jgi:FkbM family methyltransferase
MSSTSQYGEHLIIEQHFAGRVGHFLDIGAFDGFSNSNTWLLAQAGWTGVCVEPSPPAFCELMKRYHGNPRVHLVNAAIAKQAKLATFHCNSEDGTHCDQVSTLDPKHLQKWGGFPFTKMLTPTLTYDALMAGLTGAEISTHFDFVNIDVEGINDEVLLQAWNDIELTCVELDPLDRVMQIAEHFGYKRLQVVGGNLLCFGGKA